MKTPITPTPPDLTAWRIWPDGTTQEIEDGDEPHSWMSDDFVVLHAEDEAQALVRFEEMEERAWRGSPGSTAKHISTPESSV